MSDLLMVGIYVEATTPYVLAFSAKANDQKDPYERNIDLGLAFNEYDAVYREISKSPADRLKKFNSLNEFAAYRFEEIQVRHLFINNQWQVKIGNKPPVANG